jgi:hypothetical protein
MYLQCTLMYFNVFIDIVIRILPSHSYYNDSTMSIHLHILFLLPTITPFSILTLHVYVLSYILHFNLSLVVRSIVKPKFFIFLLLELAPIILFFNIIFKIFLLRWKFL